MLKEIISVPIFIQLSTFAAKLAIVLFYLEIVSIVVQHCVFNSSLPIYFYIWNIDFRIFSSIFLYEQSFARFTIVLLFLVYILTVFTVENFVTCYFMTKISHDGCLIGDMVYGMSWYKLPIADQFTILRIIHRAQEPFAFTAAGIIIISLSTYMKVISGWLEQFQIHFSYLFKLFHSIGIPILVHTKRSFIFHGISSAQLMISTVKDEYKLSN